MGKLSNSSDNAVDTEGRILEAYVNQCTAEAQEGIINIFIIFTFIFQYGMDKNKHFECCPMNLQVLC